MTDDSITILIQQRAAQLERLQVRPLPEDPRKRRRHVERAEVLGLDLRELLAMRRRFIELKRRR